MEARPRGAEFVPRGHIFPSVKCRGRKGTGPCDFPEKAAAGPFFICILNRKTKKFSIIREKDTINCEEKL
ncbi:MAG: hypothetical protein DBX49_01890 [Clostridia bacterium]|nr:MAG: hypothetical protein DBX49_01890 [Clostridia bacterium]